MADTVPIGCHYPEENGLKACQGITRIGTVRSRIAEHIGNISSRVMEATETIAWHTASESRNIMG